MHKFFDRFKPNRPLPAQPDLDPDSFTMGPVDAPVGCLLIHGFSGNPSEMRWMGNYLAEQGMRVEAVRLAGHGTDPAELKHITWRDWLQSAAEGLERLAHGRGRVVIVGFSMGGLLGLHLCAANPELVSGLITIASPVYFRDRRIHLIPVVRHLVHWHHVRRPGTHIDPEAHTRYRAYRRYPLIAVDQLLDLMRVTRKVIPQVSTPTLIMHGMRDHVIHPKSAYYLFRQIGASAKELVWWGNSGHGVVFDAEREDVWRRVYEFALEGVKRKRET
jgi:carboxylesterase